MDKPTGEYGIWTDTFVFVEVVRRMKDFAYFRDLFTMGNLGILPAWPYTALLFWKVFPSETGLVIQRLTGTFYDLGTVWALYLCGKEMAGRRAGLLAAVLASVSKPLLSKVVSGYPTSILVFGVTLVIWSQIRLLGKNSIQDFLLWSFGIGFLACTTSPMLALAPFFIFSSLALLWWKNRSAMSIQSIPPFIWISAIAFLFYFLCCLNGFPNGDHIVSQIKHFSPLIFLTIFGIIGIFHKRLVSREVENLWFKWFCGAWLAVLLSFRTFTDDYIIGRIKYHSLVSGAGFLNLNYFKEVFFHQLPDTFTVLFWSFQDRGDMGLPGDSFFSYTETIVIALGLIFYFAQPDAKRSFLLVTAAIAIIPYFSMSHNYSVMFIGCITPLLLVSAMAFNDFLEMIFSVVRKKLFQGVVYFLLIVFWAWSAQGVFSRVYPQWAEKGNHYALPRDMALKDIEQGRRVYLSRELFDYSPEFYEGFSVYLLHQFNPINLNMNEKVPDVVIYLVTEEGALVNKLKDFFPDLKFENLSSQCDGGVVEYRLEIPSARLFDKKQKLFLVARTPDPAWKRIYNYHINAIRGSIDFSRIDWEDRVIDVNTPLPKVAREQNDDFEGQAYKLQTSIHVNHSGEYEISCKTDARTKMMVDGNIIFDLKFLKIGDFYEAPTINRKVQLNLTKGDHQVEVITLTQPPLPDITIRAVGFNGEGQSLWKSFVFN